MTITKVPFPRMLIPSTKIYTSCPFRGVWKKDKKKKVIAECIITCIENIKTFSLGNWKGK